MASVIVMPRLSPTMEEGVLAKWTKKEGDKISPGDVIAEVETDKANMDFPLEDEGVLLKLLVKEGDTVKLGDPVAVLGEAGEDPAEAMKSAKAATATATKTAAAVEKKAEGKEIEDGHEDEDVHEDEHVHEDEDVHEDATASAKASDKASVKAEAKASVEGVSANGRVRASPFARKLARDKGVDLRSISGSGPHGRVIQSDILAAAERGPAVARARAPVSPVSKEDALKPASQMRKTIARRLVEAKREIPHIYLTADATVDRLLDVREQLNELGAESGGAKISVNDLFVKALALALRRVPDANVSWTPEGIVHHGRVDIGVAVSLPDGLLTPVVRDADGKSLGEIAREVKSLAERARAKKLKPEEFTGGTATLSNLGMYGVREFVAIINPPEAVILAVGATEKRAIVVERDGGDQVQIARRVTLTLSCDHRAVDGVLGAQLLAELVKLLEKPMALVV